MSENTALRARTAATPSIGDRLDRMPITPTHRRLTAVIGVGLLFSSITQLAFGAGLGLSLPSGIVGGIL